LTPTAALVARYADRFHAALVDGAHTVTSPLGGWLLLAVVAPAATGEERARLEEVLGTDVDDACARATAVLADPHPAVAVAAAVWARPEHMAPAFPAWAARVRGPVTVGGMPTPAEADAWARAHTLDLIRSFPASIDSDTTVVLADALATRVRWEVPFDRVPSSLLGGSWADAVGTVLSSAPAHRIRIVRTVAAGDVACHEARSHDGLRVCSVLADPAVAPDRVLAAAHECATPTASTVSLFDLAVGDGPAWSIREVTAVRPERTEYFHAWLPAWSASADHDLGAAPGAGFVDGLTALRGLCAPGVEFDGSARQVAVASYGAEGFEAAAVTVMAQRASAVRRGDPEPVRFAEVRFARPFGVVAVAEAGDDSPWHDLPVFAAWIATPTDA